MALAGGLLAVATVAVRVAPALDQVFIVVTAVAGLPVIVLGNVVAWREPRNVVGVLLAGWGLTLLAISAWDAYGAAVLARPGSLPSWDVLLSIFAGVGTWMWLFVPPALVALFFPTGRLPGPRWRLVAVGLPLIATLFMLGAAMAPVYGPPFQDVPKALGVLPLSVTAHTALLVSMLPLFMACLVASAMSLRVRYRRVEDVERAQLKWFALAGLTIPATLVLCWLSYLLLSGPDLVIIGLVVMFFSIPAATTFAILRYDLYDVDRVVSTTVTYVLVSAALLGLFGLTSLVLGLIIGDSRVATAAATAAAALALQPLRARLQRGVNRRLYPLRQGALTGIEDLRRRTAMGEARPEQLEAALQGALHDRGLRVGYRAPGGDVLMDVDGQPLEAADGAIPVRSGTREIGVLVFDRKVPPGLAREIADAAAVLVELVILRLGLNRALEDVAASRARLLQAGYAERRRLERDLHDGAQQRLVSLGMALRVAQRHLTDGSVDVHGVLDEAVTELSTAVAELRQIANGLRPSALDDGLAPALQILTSKMPFVIDLDVTAGDLDDAVSTTAYYVAAEAVTNAIKHAQPGRIALSVAQDDGQVEVRVRDDGLGGAVLRPGSGLAGLRDRVAAIGGSLDVSSIAGAGTEVRAVLPCAS